MRRSSLVNSRRYLFVVVCLRVLKVYVTECELVFIDPYVLELRRCLLVLFSSLSVVFVYMFPKCVTLIVVLKISLSYKSL